MKSRKPHDSKSERPPHRCEVDDDALTKLCSRSSTLTALNIRSCRLLTPAALHAVASYLPALIELNVSKLPEALTDDTLAALAIGCASLRKLHAAASDYVSFGGVQAVSRLAGLRELSLAGDVYP
jgi:hypothetical protein